MASVLRIGFLSTLYHTSHLLRSGGKIEKELGLACRWDLFGTGPEMIQAFARNEIDLGYIGLPPALIGISSGIPIVCVAGGHVEGTVMVGPARCRDLEACSGFEAFLRQFHRSRIGIPARGSIHDVIFRDLLMRHPGQEIEIVNFRWADLIPHGLRKGEIDCAVGTPPLAVLCERELGTRILVPPGKFWPFSPSCGIVVRREFLTGTEDVLLEGVLRLHEEACNLIRRCPEEAARSVVLALPGVDEALVQEVYRISPHYCASLPDPYIQSGLDFIPVLTRLGYLKKPLRPEEPFDTRTIQRTHPAPHHYTDPERLGVCPQPGD